MKGEEKHSEANRIYFNLKFVIYECDKRNANYEVPEELRCCTE
jgi:hypothetical protein